MNKKETAEIIVALSEDFTLKELMDPNQIFKDVEYFFGIKKIEAIPLVMNAIQVRILKMDDESFKRLRKRFKSKANE